MQACAHRYRKITRGSVSGLGYCIPFNNDLNEGEPIEPCSGQPLSKVTGDGESVLYYAMCQAGVSVALHNVREIISGLFVRRCGINIHVGYIFISPIV